MDLQANSVPQVFCQMLSDLLIPQWAISQSSGVLAILQFGEDALWPKVVIKKSAGFYQLEISRRLTQCCDAGRMGRSWVLCLGCLYCCLSLLHVENSKLFLPHLSACKAGMSAPAVGGWLKCFGIWAGTICTFLYVCLIEVCSCSFTSPVAVFSTKQASHVLRLTVCGLYSTPGVGATPANKSFESRWWPSTLPCPSSCPHQQAGGAPNLCL